MTEDNPKWLASFILRTNLRVQGVEAAESRYGVDVEIYLSNVSYDGSGTYYLELKIIFSAPDVSSADREAADIAEDVCHTLSFVSDAAVKVQRPVFLINWDRGIRTRDMLAYSRH